jgi:tubulin---tyrosine ligase
VQIGLYHYFQDKGPIDCVISGPNYGRNSTAVFGLSSGTLGGALEAAVCRKKSFAISYAFDSRNHDPKVIAAASRQSVKLVEHLHKNWDDRVDLYSINVPLIEDVEKRKILQTDMLQNYWGPHSCFEEAEDDIGDANEEEQRIREGEPSVDENGTSTPMKKHKHKHFKWAPRFVDVHKSVEVSAPGNDGWAVRNHFTRFASTSLLISYANCTSA